MSTSQKTWVLRRWLHCKFCSTLSNATNLYRRLNNPAYISVALMGLERVYSLHVLLWKAHCRMPCITECLPFFYFIPTIDVPTTPWSSVCYVPAWVIYSPKGTWLVSYIRHRSAYVTTVVSYSTKTADTSGIFSTWEGGGSGGTAVAQMVEALRYKPEGQGFDSRRGHCGLLSTQPLRRADNLGTFMCRLSINSGSLNFLEP